MDSEATTFFRSFGDRLALRRYVNSELHLYLGCQYVLKVVFAQSNQVRYKGKYIEVICTDKLKVKAFIDQ